MAMRTPQVRARRPSRPAARLHLRRHQPRDLSPAAPAATRLGRKQAGRGLRPAGAPEAAFSATSYFRLHSLRPAAANQSLCWPAVRPCFRHSSTRMLSPGRSSEMLAAATSSRPAVTRRAYECGGVDADGDGIVTAGERRRQARARPRSSRSKVVDRQRDGGNGRATAATRATDCNYAPRCPLKLADCYRLPPSVLRHPSSFFHVASTYTHATRSLACRCHHRSPPLHLTAHSLRSLQHHRCCAASSHI